MKKIFATLASAILTFAFTFAPSLAQDGKVFAVNMPATKDPAVTMGPGKYEFSGEFKLGVMGTGNRGVGSKWYAYVKVTSSGPDKIVGSIWTNQGDCKGPYEIVGFHREDGSVQLESKGSDVKRGCERGPLILTPVSDGSYTGTGDWNGFGFTVVRVKE